MGSDAERESLALLAEGWDAGYEAATTLLEAAAFRLATEGKKGLHGMGKPKNPYRVGGDQGS